MKFISRCFVSTIAAAAILTPLLPAHATSVSTPIIKLADNSAAPLDFHLVSQVTNPNGYTYTTIQLDGLSSLMSGAIFSPAGSGSVQKQLSAAQTLDMLIDPHYAPVSAQLSLNITYSVWGGASWSGTRLDVHGNIGYNETLLSVGQGSGTNDISAYQYYSYGVAPEYYTPAENKQPIELKLNADMLAASSPWSDGSVSFKTNSAILTFATVQISPVPEPDAVLLMLAGLAVVGVAAKRRPKSGKAS